MTAPPIDVDLQVAERRQPRLPHEAVEFGHGGGLVVSPATGPRCSIVTASTIPATIRPSRDDTPHLPRRPNPFETAGTEEARPDPPAT